MRVDEGCGWRELEPVTLDEVQEANDRMERTVQNTTNHDTRLATKRSATTAKTINERNETNTAEGS